MAINPDCVRRATAAWEKHNAAPRISGGPDGLRREFMAGYYAREAELNAPHSAEPEMTVRKATYWVPIAVNADGVPLSHGEPMVEVEPGKWMDAMALAELQSVGLDHNWRSVTNGPVPPAP